jgi:hypothetical protein
MEQLFNLLRRVEQVALLLLFAGALFNILQFPGASMLLQISLTALASTFLLQAFNPSYIKTVTSEQVDFLTLMGSSILPKVMWISCAVGTVGILFALLHLPGASHQLMVSCFTIIIALVWFAILRITRPNLTSDLSPVLYRALPIAIASIYLLTQLVEAT